MTLLGTQLVPESWQREAAQNESFTAIPNEQSRRSGIESGNSVAVHRAELLKHYDMQDNAEFILLYKLRQIGVDVEKWTAEPQTQKVVLKE